MSSITSINSLQYFTYEICNITGQLAFFQMFLKYTKDYSTTRKIHVLKQYYLMFYVVFEKNAVRNIARQY